MYEVVAGIAIPGRKYGVTGDSPKYPFKLMRAGDSFLVPAEGQNKKRLQQKLAALAGKHSRHRGTKYVTRQLEDGVRVWRVL